MKVTKSTNKSGKQLLRGTQGGKIHSDVKKKAKKARSNKSQSGGSMHIVRGATALSYDIDYNRFDISNRNLAGGGITTIKSCAVLTPMISRDSGALEIGARVPMHPRNMGSYRLAQMADLYTSYRFKKIVLKWCPRVPTTAFGTIGIFYVDDPTEIVQTSSFGASNDVGSIQTESIILESEHRFLGPVWEPAVMTRANFGGERQNNWFRCSLASGQILDEIQGLIFCACYANVATDTELGIVEIDYEIEFCHPVSPVRYQVNGNPQGGYTLDLGKGTLDFHVASASTSGATYNFWVNAQGVYLATCNKFHGDTTQWEVPAKTGAAWFIKVDCGKTYDGTSEQFVTTFTFYNSYSAYLSDDVLECADEKWTEDITLNKIVMFKVSNAITDMRPSSYAPTIEPSKYLFKESLEKAKQLKQNKDAQINISHNVSSSSFCDSVTSLVNHSITDYSKFDNFKRR